ncbi:unnamed protein product, partial [Staurois parvus]
QTASTNICKRLCNKSIREISLLLNIPRSTVSGIITKWKQLGTTATQPQSGRPRKMTERGQRMLSTQCTEVANSHFMKWISKAEQLHPSLTSPSAMQRVGCSG